MDQNKRLQLWFNEEAKYWVDGLPVGNGRFGAIVEGGKNKEKIYINEDTLWSGGPESFVNEAHKEWLPKVQEMILNKEYKGAQEIVEKKMLGKWKESYQPMGWLDIEYIGLKDIQEYKRGLDIENALAYVEFKADGYEYSREVFVSKSSEVIAICLKTNAPQGLDINVQVSSQLKHGFEEGKDSVIHLSGQAYSHVEPNYVRDALEPLVDDGSGMLFDIRTDCKIEEGVLTKENNVIKISKTKCVWVYIGGRTSFNGYDKDPIKEGKPSRELCIKDLEGIEDKSYNQIREIHIEDYQAQFKRVDFCLYDEAMDTNISLPTNVRLDRVKNGLEDLSLLTLYYQFGRYLLIASSQRENQPANLQGIWNTEGRPAWSSNWTTNINTQMNYWLAETTHLSDCHEPLLDMVYRLSQKGKETAKEWYGCRGWVANHNIDIWQSTSPVANKAQFAYWPMASGWLCQHIWQHYAFTLDLDYLDQKGYQIMKEAALFYLDFMVETKEGGLTTAPSTSPENNFLLDTGEACSVSAGSTMDITIIKELFRNCIEATKLLKRDENFARELRNALDKLPEYRIGESGQLQEWSEDFKEHQIGHRHLSHLYGLYPGDLIDPYTTPELANAARTSLLVREEGGSGWTGWSCAWFIGLWARLKDGEKAYESIVKLLANSTNCNLFDTHPMEGREAPLFQIDGNFGATASMTEMLLQSHKNIIQFLPALPKAWQQGHIKGLKARGDIEINIEWKENALLNASIKSKIGGPISIRSCQPISVKNQDEVEVKVCSTNQIYTFEACSDKWYSIQF